MEKIQEAFKHVPRSEFLPEDTREDALLDRPLSIGYGQKNSQPSTVRVMLRWLDVQPSDHVLDVGSGSGWTTALLAYLVGKHGTVHAAERVPELVEFGRENCKLLAIKNVFFHQANTTLGWPDQAPYDRILVSASADSLPQELVDQLKPGGKMVIPVREAILEVTTNETGEVFVIRHEGFVFVPLLM